MDPHYVYAQEPLGDEDSRVLKQGDSFAIFDHYGNISRKGLGEEGLFYDGTRFLSAFHVRLLGVRPMILYSTIKQDNSLMTVDMTNPDLTLEDGTFLPRGSLHLFRSVFLWEGTLYEKLRFRSFQQKSIRTTLSLFFEADFADIFEVRGTKRSKRGEYLGESRSGEGLLLAYRGLDGMERSTLIASAPGPREIRKTTFEFDLHLEGNCEREFLLTVNCRLGQMPKEVIPHDTAFSLAGNAFARAKKRTANVSSSHAQFNDWIARSEADLHMMCTDTRYGKYPYAGVPWFSTPFGRDGILTALQCLWFFPEMAKGVLTFLSATQAAETSPERDAQPGKILHETRGGEMAALGEIPFGRYYGSVDSTPLFVLLAGKYFERTGDIAFLKTLWPHVMAALDWLERDGDADRDGFVEYFRHSSKGLVHQGWKDSEDSVSLADGTLAEGPIALCEVQGYVYAAKKEAAKMARALGDGVTAETLDSAADTLRTRFQEVFWCEELGTYALALDGKKRRCAVRSSNAGQCLFTGISNQTHARAMAKTLFGEDSFSGWGIRTLSSLEMRFNPMSYHNGSIWPHDNSLIALGLAKYNLKAEALRILEGLFEASLFVNLHRMPELFCGFPRRAGEGPTPYPVACSPQSWAAGSVFLLLEAALGIHIEVLPRAKITLRHPELPEFLNELLVHDLRIGEAKVDLLLRRHREDIGVNVLKREGDVEIVVLK